MGRFFPRLGDSELEELRQLRSAGGKALSCRYPIAQLFPLLSNLSNSGCCMVRDAISMLSTTLVVMLLCGVLKDRDARFQRWNGLNPTTFH